MNQNRQDKEQAPDLTPTLIGRLRNAHDEAGALLDSLYRERLTGFCLGYLGNRDQAEDVVQDVFFRVLKSDTVPDNFRAWIYKICRNRSLDVQRAAARRRDDQSLPAASYVDAGLTGALTNLVQQEQKDHLKVLIAGLPETQREALILRYGEGLSRGEIAEVLEIPVEKVKSQLFHGLEKLRDHDSLRGV